MDISKFYDKEFLFRRYKGNPILSPEIWPYRVNAVFNPGAVIFNGTNLLLVRVEDMRGFSHLTVATSKDGITDWKIDNKPTFEASPNCPEEAWGIEDCRVVWLEDLKEYAITYVGYSKMGPLVCLAMTTNFKDFRRIGVILHPEDKDASLFPRKIKGRYAIIHRPIIRQEAHMWISFSHDLKYWGDHHKVIETRSGYWDNNRVGLGPPPIETPDGWLIVYHGVRGTAAGKIYRVGLALLDLEEPWKVLYRTEDWVFGPSARYERMGDVPRVVFPTGVIIPPGTNEFRMYYGAADMTVGVAVGDFKEILDYVKNFPVK